MASAQSSSSSKDDSDKAAAACRLCVFNHVGISVPNCDEAVEWYSAVFGLRPLKPVLHVRRETFASAPIFRVFDGDLREFKMAWLAGVTAAHSSSESVGLEIFEFIEPRHRKPEGPDFGFDYARGGFFHVAMTVPDPDALCAKVVAAGGRKMGETVPLPHGNMAAYCQDPWGNAIELVTTSFERMVQGGAPKDD